MRRLINAIAVCLLGCVLFVPGESDPRVWSSPPPPPPVASQVVITIPERVIISYRQPRRVLIVGDSEACAVSGYINLKKLVWQIDDETGQPHDDVHVSCKGGTVVSYWGVGGHFRQALREYPHPDDVIIFLGTNHYWQKQAPNVSEMLDQLTFERHWAGHDVNCVWVGNTAVHGKKWAINGLIRDAVTPSCSYFDTEAADIPLADGVHPTPAGAVKWVRSVWKTIPPKYQEEDQ